MTPNEIASLVGATILGIGVIAYAVATAFSKYAEAADKAQKDAIEASERVIALYKEERQMTDSKMDTLTTRVETLTSVVMELACKKAPTCKNRVKPEACLDCVISHT